MEVETVQVARPKPKPWKKIGIILLTSLLMLAVLIFSGLYLYTRDNGLILEGIKIGTIDLSNLSISEAQQKLEDYTTPLLDQTIEFQIQAPVSETVKRTLKDLGLAYDLEKVIQYAYQQGREENIVQRAISKHQARKGSSAPLTLDSHWNKDQLDNTLKTAFSSYNKPLTEASFKITPDNRMAIEKELPGQDINLDTLAQNVESLDPLHPTPIAVPLHVLDKPQVTAAQLEGMQITGLVAKYSTQFDPNNVQRTENLRLAAKALDGVVLTPGGEFSFNKTVGERTASAGYKEALIIVDDQFVPGLGGGICQVSSTLYNAAILAKLNIVERHPHSLEITYVPEGQDATVAYPYLDLKFKNNTPGMLLIRSIVQGRTLTFELYGKA